MQWWSWTAASCAARSIQSTPLWSRGGPTTASCTSGTFRGTMSRGGSRRSAMQHTGSPSARWRGSTTPTWPASTAGPRRRTRSSRWGRTGACWCGFGRNWTTRCTGTSSSRRCRVPTRWCCGAARPSPSPRARRMTAERSWWGRRGAPCTSASCTTTSTWPTSSWRTSRAGRASSSARPSSPPTRATRGPCTGWTAAPSSATSS
mmetsp:Transcript_50083/g.160311  ORF Transcript_50083/g.160311 Transcript_50083/m.160311 type:complete len:204 (+) Transcript_50083:917-1528(+)